MRVSDKFTENKNKILSETREVFDEHPVIKFVTIAGIILVYFFFVSRSHGVKEGFWISILTWSFFVLGTPFPDAGILIDFPMRLISGIKMIYSEIVVTFVAIAITAFTFFKIPAIYGETGLLSLFNQILSKPFPYWAIIILSSIGTFSLIYLADNLIDSTKKKRKHLSFLVDHKTEIFVILSAIIVVIYYLLLAKLGISVPRG